MSKLTTHQPRVPWSWLVWTTIPWVSFFYAENISNGPLTFTLRKFIEDPALIAFLSSLNLAFNFLVGVVASYMSDRIWTRWGRRRPFLIVGWTGVALTLIWVPLAPNAWSLIVLIVLYQFFSDIAKPLEPLHNELIPPQQRGRAATVRNIAQNLMNMFFFGVMVAHFDREFSLSAGGVSWEVSGETAIYWGGSVLLMGAVLFLVFCVREAPPPEEIRPERFALIPFFREVFGQRQWWLVYLLYSVPLLVMPGIYVFGPLVATEQLAFSKADFGYAVTVAIVVNIVVFIPLAGYVADHAPRLRFLQVSIAGYALVSFGYFLFLRFADYRISLAMLIGTGIALNSFRSCINLVWGPLVYDFIPRDRFGTVSAGFAFVGGIVPFVLINLAGAWIHAFTALFGPAGGSKFDYSSLYVLQLLMSAVALGATVYLQRQIRLGRLVHYGVEALRPAHS
jgi:Na+/melibiose symporter-like transporter